MPEPAKEPSGGPVDVVVVGGGIAGLVAAWSLREHRVVLLESTHRVGGRIRSEPRGAYWLNLGAHLFPPPGGMLHQVLTELGMSTSPVRGRLTALAARGKVLTSGRVETYPLRLPLSPRARISFLKVGVRLYRAIREYTDLLNDRGPEASARLLAYRADTTFADFAGPTEPEVGELMRAAINRISAEPEELTAGAGVALLQFAGIFGHRMESTEHGNLQGGSALLPELLGAGMGEAVTLGADVTCVRQGDAGVVVDFDHGGARKSVTAHCAVVATPAYVTKRIVPDLPEPLRSALDQIAYGPYVVGAILTNEETPMPWDDLYAMLVVGKSFNYLFNTASILRTRSPRQPGGALMVYGAAGKARALLDLSDDEVRNRFLKDLQGIYPETREIVEEVIIQRWPAGLPYARPGRHLLQPALETRLGKIALAGDYTAPFAEMETAAQSGARAADQVKAVLRR